MYQNLIRDLKKKMDEVLEKLQDEFKKIHTGRANSTLVEEIKVAYYGTQTSLKQMANISTPDANLIVIQPWDANSLGDIENAIRNSELKVNPVNDGKVVRISLPPLTEERRNELIKLIRNLSEEARVTLRNLRGEVWDEVRTMEKDGKVTEDDKYKAEDELNKLVNEYNRKIEEAVDKKETDLKKI